MTVLAFLGFLTSLFMADVPLHDYVDDKFAMDSKANSSQAWLNKYGSLEGASTSGFLDWRTERL